MDILEELRWRGLIAQVSDAEGLGRLLSGGPQRVYVGFDPTANSLHIGNLVPLMALRRFQLAGHVPIALLGGGTGLIGDPSGKSSERNLNEKELVDEWLVSIRQQVSHVLDLEGPAQAIVVDNYDWLGRLSLAGFLRDVGKHFSVNAMVAKESVKVRLNREGEGISYTEFSYMLLQAYDFFHLCETRGCRLQLGGNDQWGNITAGIELIRRKLQREAYGLTLPLITTASGTKFGKTEKGTVWLDARRTSPYAFYQYWMNVDDRDVVAYLKLFTLLSQDEIEPHVEATRERPERRESHQALAREMTTLVHGPTEAARVLQATAALFGPGDLRELEPEVLDMALESVPRLDLEQGEEAPTLSTLLVESGLFPSKTRARQGVASGSVYANGERIQDPEHRPGSEDFLHGRSLVLRRGRKTYALVRRG